MLDKLVIDCVEMPGGVPAGILALPHVHLVRTHFERVDEACITVLVVVVSLLMGGLLKCFMCYLDTYQITFCKTVPKSLLLI